MTEPPAPKAPGRRPIKARSTSWARWLARRLAASSVTPNQISFAGLMMGIVAGAALAIHPELGPVAKTAALLSGVVLIGLRLLCNMLDGLVAVEGGKASPTGAFWNELPDRLADIAILVGAGYAAGEPSLGWAAAALAVFTAYVRLLGELLAGRSDFSGPMAKPHRMALVIGAGGVASALPDHASTIFHIALGALVAGTALTAGRRCLNLYRSLRARPGDASRQHPTEI